MMKRILAFTLALVCCFACGWAMAAQPAVIDDARLFAAYEEAELESLIEAFREETGMDFAIFTSDAAYNASQQEVSDAIYEQGGYGLDEERSGVLYYIDMYNRIPYLATTGKMIDYLTDERIEAAHENSYGYLANGQYGNAAAAMIQAVASYVKRGIPEGQYQYDVVTGEYVTPRHKALTGSEILVSALIGLVVALLYTKSVQGSYTLKGSTYNYDVRSNVHMQMTDTQDQFLRTTTTRTRKAPPPSAGGSSPGRSSVHTSSGGMRHGGGAGRKF